MRSTLCYLLVVCSGLVVSTACSAKVPDDPRHPSQRKEQPSPKEIEQEREWIAIDKTSSAALQAYLDKKPRGSRHKEAAVLLPVAKKLEAILSGAEKPAVVIPFDLYGEPVPGEQKKIAKAVSYNAKLRTDKDVGACWTYRDPEFEDCGSFTKGVHAAGTYAAFPRATMAGPGSILAFDSGGERCPHDRLPVIVSAKGKIVHFGVVAGTGYVHLSGEGEVAYPDGKVVRFR